MTAVDLHEWAHRVSSKDELAAFAAEVARQVQAGQARVDNDRIDVYLEAMSAWLADSDGYYHATGVDGAGVAPWARMAAALVAALVYE